MVRDFLKYFGRRLLVIRSLKNGTSLLMNVPCNFVCLSIWIGRPSRPVALLPVSFIASAISSELISVNWLKSVSGSGGWIGSRSLGGGLYSSFT